MIPGGPDIPDIQESTKRRPISVLTATLVSGMVAWTSLPIPDGSKLAKPTEGSIVVVPIRLTKQTDPQREATGNVPACDMIERAAQANPAAIVLDIDGGGASADELEKLGSCIVKVQEQGQRVVAWPDHVQGTAVEITLACREIACRPDTLIGTPASSTNSRTPTEPSAQLASRIAKVTGRSDCIAKALREPRAELWWSPAGGFRATRGEGPDWRQLDDGSGIRPLSSSDLERYRLRTGMAASRSELWSALSSKAAAKLTRDTPLVVMEPSQAPPPRQPPAQTKTEPQKPDPEKRATQDAKRIATFTTQLQSFQEVLKKASSELEDIQRYFPGTYPGGDFRDEATNAWWRRTQAFDQLRPRATKAVANCVRTLPSLPDPRPVEADAAQWKKLQDVFTAMRKDLKAAGKNLSTEAHWSEFGTRSALETLKNCEEFVSALLK